MSGEPDSTEFSLAAELDALAGGWGIPAALQYTADHLPGSATTHVVYDVSVGLGLLLGDLAQLVEAVEGAEAGTCDAQGHDNLGTTA